MHIRDYSLAIRVACGLAFVGAAEGPIVIALSFALAYSTIVLRVPTAHEIAGLIGGVFMLCTPVYNIVIQIWCVITVGILIATRDVGSPTVQTPEPEPISEPPSLFECF